MSEKSTENQQEQHNYEEYQQYSEYGHAGMMTGGEEGSEDALHQAPNSSAGAYTQGTHAQYPHSQAPMHMGYGSSFGQRADPMVSFLGTFPCLRLLSFPQDLAMTEILRIFESHYVLDIVPLAYPTAQGLSLYGDVFVLFSTINDSARALQSLKGKPVRVQTSFDIRQFHIQIEPASREQYYHAVSMSVTQPQSLRKMPQDYSYGPPTMHYGMGAGQYSDMSQGGGMHGRGASSIHSGPRPTQSRKNAGRGGSGRGGGIRDGEHTGFIRMRGLPFDYTKDQILEFFDGCKVIKDSICLTYRSDGRVTGEGYIAFETPEDAKAAMTSHHKRMMGSRYIELFISNKEEHDRAKEREPSEEALKSFSKMTVH